MTSLKSVAFVLPAICVTASLLTGCCGRQKPETVSPTIFAPSSLVFPSGKPLVSKEGTYVPATDEIWYSQKTHEELQDRLMSALEALEHQRNNP